MVSSSSNMSSLKDVDVPNTWLIRLPNLDLVRLRLSRQLEIWLVLSLSDED